MKLVLHPGHSKCGSTTIQKAIIKNRSLLEDSGYVIPDPQMRTKGDDGFNPNGETPRPFFRHVMEEKDIPLLKKKLKIIKDKFSSDDTKILISAENLVNQLNKPAGINIHKVFTEFFDDYKILYYIRRQDKFIMSAWQQWGYKRGMLLDEFVRHAIKMRNPNYRVVADAFSQLYGKEKVSVVPLEDRALYKSSLLEDFFEKLSAPKEMEFPVDTVDNKSLNPYVCEAFSQSNSVFRDIHDETIKERLVKLSGGHPGLFYRGDGYFTNKLRSRVLKAFEEDNLYMKEKFFPEFGWAVSDLEGGDSKTSPPLEEVASQASHALAAALSSLLK